MTTFARRATLALALPLALGAPVILSAPAEAAGPVQIALVSSASPSVYGQPVTITATITSAGEAPQPVPSGTVEFRVSDYPEQVLLGEVPVNAQGKATSPVLHGADGLPLDRTFGSDFYSISAIYHPAPGDDVQLGNESSIAQWVNQAASSTTVTVGQDVVFADVVGVAPGGQQTGSLKPDGIVSFSVGGHQVGTAEVTPSGRAAFPYDVSGGSTQLVSVVYQGGERYTGSSDSVSRSDPIVSAFTFSQSQKTRSGWYRTGVEVIFTCRTPNGATLLGGCPGRASLRTQGAGQSVTRTVYASDGGVATVVVGGINIDKTAPKIEVTGGRCKATDKLSGVSRCKVKSLGGGDFLAVAVDHAGNRATLEFSRR